MIEITHKQAMRWIGAELDSPAGRQALPEEQWAALQVHLETCASCRAFLQRRKGFEKDLTRSLSLRWNRPEETGLDLTESVSAAASSDRARQISQKTIVSVSGLVLAALVIGLTVLEPFFGRRALERTQAVFQAATADALETAAVSSLMTETAPTPVPPGEFRGLLAFESSHSGNSEIYLLNTGPGKVEMSNLTESEGRDWSPAWSPDGEWLAFLSDRSGRPEVYVVSVAGTRLTRLTSQSNLEWHGPLTWSAEGRWIAARAARLDQEDDLYIYMVPLDGRERLVSVANSRSASSAPVFSPVIPSLAFQASGDSGWLYAYDYEAGEYAVVNAYEIQNDDLRLNGPFDWALGGMRLLYQAGRNEVQDSSYEVRLSNDVTQGNNSAAFSTSWGGETATGEIGYGSISNLPGSQLAVLVRDNGQDCATLRVYQINRPARAPEEIPGLCVTSAVTRANWTMAGPGEEEAWLVVRGTRPAESSSRFFALRLSSQLPPGSIAERGQHLEEVSIPGLMAVESSSEWPGEPQVRPERTSLGIEPRASEESENNLLLSRNRPLNSPSKTQPILAAGVLRDEAFHLLTLSPDGSKVQQVNRSRATCPVLSPDGSRMAFTSHVAGGERLVQELFVAELSGGEPLQLTSQDFGTGPNTDNSFGLPFYECPVWAPDGTVIAAIYRTTQAIYLAVVPAAGSSEASYLQLEPTVRFIAWPGVGEANGPIFQVGSSFFNRPPRIDSIDLESPENKSALKVRGAAVEQTLAEFRGYDAIAAFAISPGGGKEAVILLNYSSDGKGLITQAYLVISDIGEDPQVKELGEIQLVSTYQPSLTWLEGGRVGFLQPLGINQADKAVLRIYDSQSQSLMDIARLGDLTTSAAWSQDGRWAFIGGESGIFALDVQRALDGEAVPVRILADRAIDLDYR